MPSLITIHCIVHRTENDCNLSIQFPFLNASPTWYSTVMICGCLCIVMPARESLANGSVQWTNARELKLHFRCTVGAWPVNMGSVCMIPIPVWVCDAHAVTTLAFSAKYSAFACDYARMRCIAHENARSQKCTILGNA